MGKFEFSPNFHQDSKREDLISARRDQEGKNDGKQNDAGEYTRLLRTTFVNIACTLRFTCEASEKHTKVKLLQGYNGKKIPN